MNEERVKEWILKAKNDLKIGKDEIKTKNPATDAICFHMQQCVEKYLKAFLTLKNKEFRKTHDLTELIKNCSDIDNEFEKLYELNVDSLTEYATELRYPGDFLFPSIEETKKAIELTEKVIKFMNKKLKDLDFKKK